MRKFLFAVLLILEVFCISAFAFAIKAPNFELKDLSGKEHSLAQYQGKSIFLVFWSKDCHFCLEELPIIEKLYKEYNKNKDSVIFITFSRDELEPLQEFLKENNYTFPTIKNDSIFNQYLISGVPTNYIVDKNGEVAQIVIAPLKEAELLSLIEDPNTLIER